MLIKEFLQSPEFKKQISIKLTEIENKRRDVILNARKNNFIAGFKKSPYDYLKDKSMLNPNILSDQAILIAEKKSNLPASVRNYLQSIFTGVIAEFLKTK